MNQSLEKDSILDVAVIGAGHAGLSISYCLKQHGINHLVFERGQVGEAWRSQRWDSFVMNTANKNNILPGQIYTGNTPDGFGTASEFVESLEAYAAKNQLPVREHIQVNAVNKSNGSSNYTITVSENGVITDYVSKLVVITSGCQNEIRIPSFAKNISPEILQIHTKDYRNPSQLPDGAVLIVGSAQSGVQIAEDLIDSGKKVYMSTSKVARIPRRYRGKDIVDWLMSMGFFNLKTEQVTDPTVLEMKVPLLSGIGTLGHTISLQALAKKGVIILGKLEQADEHNVYLAKNAPEHVKFGDGFSLKCKGMVDEFIQKKQITADPPEMDIADIPDPNATCASEMTTLNLKEHHISSIIWTTGFNGDYSYLNLPVFNESGSPIHKNGISDFTGLYFLGLPWLRMRKSAMIFGINDDAAFITESIVQNLNK